MCSFPNTSFHLPACILLLLLERLRTAVYDIAFFSAPSQFDDLDSALVASVDHMEQSNLSSLEAASRDSELVVLQVKGAGLFRCRLLTLGVLFISQ